MKPQNNLLDLLQKDIEPFEVNASPISTMYQVTINEDFREVAQFENIVGVLDSAVPGDVVKIRLSTIGGALHAIVPLINAMKNTDAHVHVHVEADCASAGTIIMMLADSVFVNEYANIMLHTCQYGYSGHSGNMDAYVKFSTKKIEDFVKEIYYGFLNDDEIKSLLDGKEIWLDDEECHLRFELREELLNVEQEIEDNEEPVDN